jgi:hypothetical protein
MPTVERSERLGGLVVLGLPIFDGFVWLLDNYGRWELIVRLHNQLPAVLVNPVTVLLCVVGGFFLLHSSNARQLKRVASSATNRRLVDTSGAEIYSVETPGWFIPGGIVFLVALVATPIVAVVYSLAYKGFAPPPPHYPSPPVIAYLKSEQTTESAKKQESQTVTASGGSIAIGGNNNGSAVVNNYGYGDLPDVPEPGKTPTITICVSEAPVSASDSNSYFGAGSFETTITLQTDMPITRPAYGFLFDGEVGEGDVEAFGWSRTVYFNRAKLAGYETMSFVLKVLSMDFPGGNDDRWTPGVILGAKIPTRHKANIQKVFSWFGKDQTSISERLNHECSGPPPIIPTQGPAPVALF